MTAITRAGVEAKETRLPLFSGLASLAMLAIVIMGSAAQPQVSRDSIERVARLGTGRSVHTATTLASGKVLVAGGMADGGGSLADVELFDPADNTIEVIGSLGERRAGHTATLLGDGRVLIAGGHNGEYLASVEIYDPLAGRFQSAGSLTEGRSGQTATLLADGRVLFVGGVGRGWTFLRSAELYHPGTGRSESVGSMSVPRESHTATLLADGRVLVIGGHTGRRQDMEVHATAEIFSPETSRFETAGALLTARHKHDALRLADGRVLVVGGADRSDRTHFETTEIYDSGTGTFEYGPVMAHRRYKIAGTSILMPAGDVLVTSGARTAEFLDFERWTFREIPGPFPDANRFATAALLPSGDVLIAGGYNDGNRNTDGIWLYRRLR